MSHWTMRTRQGRKRGRTCGILAVLSIMVLFTCSADAETGPCSGMMAYEGKGAGRVVFDADLHLQKGIACADCHESKGLSLALFNRQRGTSDITMRKMELGRSCGYCHPVSMKVTLQCGICHQK
jgi:c(7)-type cytochrome triheme protein